METSGMNRREFLQAAGAGALAAGLLAAGVGAGEAAKPVAIGKAADFPAGTVKAFAEAKLVVLSDADGIWAMSNLCTHKFVPIAWNAEKNAFVCAAHGAMFDADGTVKKKPAKADLAWYEVRQEGDGLVVDPGRTVAKGTKFKV